MVVAFRPKKGKGNKGKKGEKYFCAWEKEPATSLLKKKPSLESFPKEFETTRPARPASQPRQFTSTRKSSRNSSNCLILFRFFFFFSFFSCFLEGPKQGHKTTTHEAIKSSSSPPPSSSRLFSYCFIFDNGLSLQRGAFDCIHGQNLDFILKLTKSICYQQMRCI